MGSDRRAPSFLYRLGEDGATEGLVCDDAVGGIAKALREGTLDVAVEPSAAAAAPAGDAPQPPCEELQAGAGAHQKRGRPVGTDRDARERAVRRRSVDEPQGADEAPPSGKTGGGSEACVDPLQGVRLERPPTPPCADGHGYPSFDIVVGCAAEQGHRPYMEDRHAVDTHFVIDDSETDAQVVAGAGTSCDGVQRSYMAVYDGHNGTRAAEYAAEHMHEMFIGNDGLAGTEPGPVPPGADEPVTMAGELKMPLLAHSTPVNDSVAVAMRRAFLRLDADILRVRARRSRGVRLRRDRAIRACRSPSPTPADAPLRMRDYRALSCSSSIRCTVGDELHGNARRRDCPGCAALG